MANNNKYRQKTSPSLSHDREIMKEERSPLFVFCFANWVYLI